jgi:hypothetical protein
MYCGGSLVGLVNAGLDAVGCGTLNPAPHFTQRPGFPAIDSGKSYCALHAGQAVRTIVEVGPDMESSKEK